MTFDNYVFNLQPPALETIISHNETSKYFLNFLIANIFRFLCLQAFFTGEA